MNRLHSIVGFEAPDAVAPRLDLRMISAMRLVLALSALVIIYIDPSEPDRLVSLTYLALVAYNLYSLLIYVLSIRLSDLLPLKFLHWLDLAWYIGLIALSSGTNSIFFFFLFFSVLVASFWWGFKQGLSVTIASAVLFTVVGYFSAPREPEFQLNRFLLRPIYLLVLGYLMAYWGGYEVRLKQRLQFLKNVGRSSNPRFGIERTINSVMHNLRAFYDADSCLLVTRKDQDEAFYLRRIDRRTALEDAAGQDLDEQLTSLLLQPSPEHAVVHSHGQTGTYHVVTGEESQSNLPPQLLNIIGDSSWLSVPLQFRHKPVGRLYLVRGSTTFGSTDVEFLLQVINQITPVIENIRLVDELASGAADQERQKIARDIHDGVIQPYIGVKLGLAAITNKLERGDTALLHDLKCLSDLVLKQIADLRNYIDGLGGAEAVGNTLVPALRRFAARFSTATGIDVNIRASEAIRLNDRLAVEVFYLITEGLSNIRRHTNAQQAEAELICENGNLILNLQNETAHPVQSFRPRSLAERTEALGGELTVFGNQHGRTTVHIQVPL